MLDAAGEVLPRVLKLISVCMERAAKSLGNLKFSGKLSGEEIARAAWPGIVGKRLARHAVAASLVRDRLVVEVDDAIWQKQLFHLRFQILDKVQEVLGGYLVRDLEFRIATPRRGPQQAAALTGQDLAPPKPDESDRIKDPVLRILYKESRKKAPA